MKKAIKMTFGVLLCSLMSFTNITGTEDKDCSVMHEGTFTYGTGAELVKVVIKGNKHTEYHNDGKYVIKSKMEWVTDCEYNMTMTKVTIPDFPFGAGAVMNVQINGIEGDQIYYTATVDGQRWNGRFLKVEE